MKSKLETKTKSSQLFYNKEYLELVYQSTRVTIIHISSIERVKKLLTIDGVSGATFEENNLSFSASPKAYVICD